MIPVSWKGFPGGSAVKNSPANVGDEGDKTRVWSLGQEDPLEKEIATHSREAMIHIPE